jgi:hypothetical protein
MQHRTRKRIPNATKARTLDSRIGADGKPIFTVLIEGTGGKPENVDLFYHGKSEAVDQVWQSVSGQTQLIFEGPDFDTAVVRDAELAAVEVNQVKGGTR